MPEVNTKYEHFTAIDLFFIFYFIDLFYLCECLHTFSGIACFLRKKGTSHSHGFSESMINIRVSFSPVLLPFLFILSLIPSSSSVCSFLYPPRVIYRCDYDIYRCTALWHTIGVYPNFRQTGDWLRRTVDRLFSTNQLPDITWCSNSYIRPWLGFHSLILDHWFPKWAVQPPLGVVKRSGRLWGKRGTLGAVDKQKLNDKICTNHTITVKTALFWLMVGCWFILSYLLTQLR